MRNHKTKQTKPTAIGAAIIFAITIVIIIININNYADNKKLSSPLDTIAQSETIVTTQSETTISTPTSDEPEQLPQPELSETKVIFDNSVFADDSLMQDYYFVNTLDPTRHSFDAVENQIDYCPLDSLSRPTCAYGILTKELRADAKAKGRTQNLPDPIGWPNNFEVDIPGLNTIDGSKDYHGWFWNRSHLVADSLGGEAIRENLAIGTRTQNVGSTNIGGEYAGGMAAPERLVRNYLDSSAANDCPIYYAVTASYTGNEMIPRSTTVEVDNCDHTVNGLYVIPNMANGFDIDYLTGTITPWS